MTWPFMCVVVGPSRLKHATFTAHSHSKTQNSITGKTHTCTQTNVSMNTAAPHAHFSFHHLTGV